MAQKYREYLTANEMLIESEKEDFAVSLHILGGLEEYTFGIPNTVLTPLTTISQAEEIVKYFDENLDGNAVYYFAAFARNTTGAELVVDGGNTIQLYPIIPENI